MRDFQAERAAIADKYNKRIKKIDWDLQIKLQQLQNEAAAMQGIINKHQINPR